MSDEKKTMELWEKVQKTNPKYAKDVKYGQKKFTAVDAYYQIKTATALWGPYGSTWGIKDTQIEFLDTVIEIKKKVNGQQQTIEKPAKMAIYKAIFFYPGGEFPINNAIKISDDEFMKKLETDTLTKALSRLGFNADVFMGLFDDSRYKKALEKEFGDDNENKGSSANPKQNQNSGGSKPTQATPKPQGSKPTSLAESIKALGLELEGNVVKGKTYGKSTQLKALGFKWNPDQKVWYLPEPQAA